MILLGDVFCDFNVFNVLVGMYQVFGVGFFGQSIISVVYFFFVDGFGIVFFEVKKEFFVFYEYIFIILDV